MDGWTLALFIIATAIGLAGLIGVVIAVFALFAARNILLTSSEFRKVQEDVKDHEKVLKELSQFLDADTKSQEEE